MDRPDPARRRFDEDVSRDAPFGVPLQKNPEVQSLALISPTFVLVIGRPFGLIVVDLVEVDGLLELFPLMLFLPLQVELGLEPGLVLDEVLVHLRFPAALLALGLLLLLPEGLEQCQLLTVVQQQLPALASF